MCARGHMQGEPIVRPLPLRIGQITPKEKYSQTKKMRPEMTKLPYLKCKSADGNLGCKKSKNERINRCWSKQEELTRLLHF